MSMLATNYARTYKSNSVLTAGPGQLVLMLFDGALRAMANAREAMARPEEDVQRLQVVNAQLLKAQANIGELQGSLNFGAGDGSLARELDRLYDYYGRRLTEANLRKQPGPVEEVERLLRELRNGWAEMLRQEQAPTARLAASVA